MELMHLSSLRDELLYMGKFAELTPKENAAYAAARSRHNSFDAKSGAGKMSEAEKAQMRHNVERLKHYRAKQKDSNYHIPDWAHKPNSSPRPDVPANVKAMGGLAGGLAGGYLGAAAGNAIGNRIDDGKGGFRTHAGRAARVVGTVGGALAGAHLGYR